MPFLPHAPHNLFPSRNILSDQKKCCPDISLFQAIQQHRSIDWMRPVIKGQRNPQRVGGVIHICTAVHCLCRLRPIVCFFYFLSGASEHCHASDPQKAFCKHPNYLSHAPPRKQFFLCTYALFSGSRHEKTGGLFRNTPVPSCRFAYACGNASVPLGMMTGPPVLLI